MKPEDFQLFIDLDGVLVDFDAGVRQATGKEPAELEPRRMWPILARTPGFYANLKWMSDGRKLWEAVLPFSPVILTGLPMGKWAEPQKRQWCNTELGADIPVITGMSRKKAELAEEWMDGNEKTGKIPLLVDDRLRIQEAWEAAGGRFVLHLDTESSLKILREVGFSL